MRSQKHLDTKKEEQTGYKQETLAFKQIFNFDLLYMLLSYDVYFSKVKDICVTIFIL